MTLFPHFTQLCLFVTFTAENRPLYSHTIKHAIIYQSSIIIYDIGDPRAHFVPRRALLVQLHKRVNEWIRKHSLMQIDKRSRWARIICWSMNGGICRILEGKSGKWSHGSKLCTIRTFFRLNEQPTNGNQLISGSACTLRLHEAIGNVAPESTGICPAPKDRYRSRTIGEIVWWDCICSTNPDIRIRLHSWIVIDMTSLRPKQDLITTFGVRWSDVVDLNGIMRLNNLDRYKFDRQHVQTLANR